MDLGPLFGTCTSVRQLDCSIVSTVNKSLLKLTLFPIRGAKYFLLYKYTTIIILNFSFFRAFKQSSTRGDDIIDGKLLMKSRKKVGYMTDP